MPIDDASVVTHGDERPLLAGHVDKRRLADEFGVSARTVERWCHERDGLPHLKLGRRTLFRLASVQSWLSRREVQRNRRRGVG